LSVLIGGIAFPAAGDEIGTKPDPDAKSGPRSNITFGLVTDLKDYGPPRNVMPRDSHAVSVRHYDGSFW
jgi:hypothetical protein